MINAIVYMMLYYSDNLINNIIDSSSDDELINNVDQFKNDINMLFTYFAYPDISLDYVNNLLNHKLSKCAFWQADSSVFNIRSCVSALIYGIYKKECYVMLICTQSEQKNKGFATKLLKQFIQDMQGKVNRILLSSVDYAVSYYQKIGFEAIDYDLNNYPYLRHFEKPSEKKITTIMEYVCYNNLQ